MNNTIFWEIIDSSKSRADGNLDAQAEIIKQRLVELSIEDIVQFEVILRQLIINADDFKIIAGQKIIDGGVTDDSYLYFRCWLIGQGFDVYTNALLNPDTLDLVVDKTTNIDFEDLLYVADQAYEIKTGNIEEEESSPRNVAYDMGIDYDSSETKGKDWTEEDLPTMLPKLWAKFEQQNNS